MAKEMELKCSVLVRLPVSVAERLKEMAAANHRSINNQIAVIVEKEVTNESRRA